MLRMIFWKWSLRYNQCWGFYDWIDLSQLQRFSSQNFTPHRYKYFSKKRGRQFFHKIDHSSYSRWEFLIVPNNHWTENDALFYHRILTQGSENFVLGEQSFSYKHRETCIHWLKKQLLQKVFLSQRDYKIGTLQFYKKFLSQHYCALQNKFYFSPFFTLMCLLLLCITFFALLRYARRGHNYPPTTLTLWWSLVAICCS